ncbi:MAG: plasmid pRiA4b ORF-3 family protein [Bacteriovoracaceae bacterium]|nr:plasmid pRiA4b ORF-3 family protein [Bacteriovoracaceae bacterium]
MIHFEIQNIRKKKTFNIEISQKDSLFDLHYMILSANKWQLEHSFSFFMSDTFWDDENEYAGDPFSSGKTKIKLEKLNLKVGDTFLFLYDYGDEHRFKIKVLSI